MASENRAKNAGLVAHVKLIVNNFGTPVPSGGLAHMENLDVRPVCLINESVMCVGTLLDVGPNS